MFVTPVWDYRNKDNDAMTFHVTVNFISSVSDHLLWRLFLSIKDPPTAIQDRIIQACTAAWSASLAFEMNRLYSDLVEIDAELAAELRAQSGECFPRIPAIARLRKHF